MAHAIVQRTVKFRQQGPKGEASVMMDLANEYQMVLTSSEGTVPAETSVVTVVIVYDGVSVASTAAPTAASITPKTGSAIVPTVTPSGSAHTHIVTYTIPKGTVLNAKYDLDISVTYKGNTYTKQLTVAASMGEPEYHLDPNFPVISFRRKSDNTLEPASRTLKMRVLKFDMDDSDDMTIAESGMIVRYTTNGTPPSSKTSGTEWGTLNGATGISWSSGNMVISNSTDVGCICVAMYNTDGVLLDRESIPVVKDGANGQDGADGNDAKMYWYEGEWSNVTTSSVTITDNQTCYFLYGGEYWMWVGGAGTYTYHDMGTPSDSNTNWEKVQSKWKYILSEAIFTEFAHLGGFIVSGSWMYSTYGTVNGVEYTSTRKQNGYYGYLWFDTSTPFTNHQISRYGTTGYNFIPNFAVDGKTGKTYQNDAYVRGEIVASQGNTSLSMKPGTQAAEIVGMRNSVELVRLGFNSNSGYLKLASENGTNYLEVKNSESQGGYGSGILITSYNNTKLYFGMSGGVIDIRAYAADTGTGRTDVWRDSSANVGAVYLDSNGYLRVKLASSAKGGDDNDGGKEEGK